MQTTAKLRTAIYMRVSTADQCVDSQRQELLQFIEKREQLDRLMIDARQRKIDVVLFFDLSRLTRKGLSHAIGLLDEWQQAGVKPICYAYPMLDFTDDAGIGKVMAAMLAWMAEQERKMIDGASRPGWQRGRQGAYAWAVFPCR